MHVREVVTCNNGAVVPCADAMWQFRFPRACRSRGRALSHKHHDVSSCSRGVTQPCVTQANGLQTKHVLCCDRQSCAAGARQPAAFTCHPRCESWLDHCSTGPAISRTAWFKVLFSNQRGNPHVISRKLHSYLLVKLWSTAGHELRCHNRCTRASQVTSNHIVCHAVSLEGLLTVWWWYCLKFYISLPWLEKSAMKYQLLNQKFVTYEVVFYMDFVCHRYAFNGFIPQTYCSFLLEIHGWITSYHIPRWFPFRTNIPPKLCHCVIKTQLSEKASCMSFSYSYLGSNSWWRFYVCHQFKFLRDIIYGHSPKFPEKQ